ncbi:transposase [Streptomyces sp. NPDC088560]|uniref:helix-turn-helix domain-containing protein n=1 Tax=Streptomyces sp. NPDC088560 TaxID=3365868 RepID=UPI00380832AC
MPVARACPIVLTTAERKRLKKMAYGHKTEHQLRCRAQIVLHAARGRSNARIAHETGLHPDTVRAWRGWFDHGGLSALADRRRSGRPARFTPVQIAETKALACQLPAERVCLFRAGPARSWPPGWPHAGSPTPSPRPRCAAACARTCSSPGSTGPGSSSAPGLPRQSPACP